MAVMAALSMALGGLNSGFFIKPMGDDLGVGRSVFGMAQSARQLSVALTAPLVGVLLDRVGARVMLAVGSIVTGAALIGLGSVTEGWQIVALFAVMGLTGINGPNSLLVVVPVTKWFVRKRARALGFLALGIPLGGLAGPGTQALIDAYGWRTSWMILGIAGPAIIVPLALLLIRRQPEDLGLRTDGEPAPPPVVDSQRPEFVPAPLEERAWTRAQALRSATFWRLALAFSAVMFGASSVALHRIPSFADRGLDPDLIALAVALDAGAAGFCTLSMGFLARRVRPRFIGAGGMLCLASAVGLSIVVETNLVMLIAMTLFGIGFGGINLAQGNLWSDYFGRRHVGSITGAYMPVMLVFSGIGAPLAGYVRDVTGTYTPAWIAAALLMLVGALVLTLTPPPQDRDILGRLGSPVDPAPAPRAATPT